MHSEKFESEFVPCCTDMRCSTSETAVVAFSARQVPNTGGELVSQNLLQEKFHSNHCGLGGIGFTSFVARKAPTSHAE